MIVKVMIFAVNNIEIDLLETKLVDNEIAIIGKSINLSNIVEETNNKKPDIAIISCGDPLRASRACQQLYLLNPKVATVLVTTDNDNKIAEMAVDVGASGLINLNLVDDSLLCNKLKTIYTNGQARTNAFLESNGTQRKAEVLTIFGTKGGIGKTTVTVNLAVSLARKNFRVAILDFDLQFGDADIFLGIESTETISDLLEEQSLATIDSIRNYFVTHSSGVQLLLAPTSPEFAEGIIPSQLEQIVNIIRPYYDYVLIDTSANFSDINLMMLELSTKIIFITGLDISLLRNSKKGLLLLDSLNQRSKVNVVLGRDIKSNISAKEVERILDCSLLSKIPNDYMTAVSALNTGIPLVVSSPKSSITQSIKYISDFISNDKVVNKRNNSKGNRLFKRGSKK